MKTLEVYIKDWKERGWNPWKIVESSKRINIGLIEENKYLRQELQRFKEKMQNV